MSVIYSGSFNPLHEGHLAIANHFEEKYGVEPIFEISLENADKGKISEEEKNKRGHQFQRLGRAYTFSELPTYISKVVYGDEKKFIIGVDTYNRLLDPKYCISEGEFHRMMRVFTRLDVMFYVYPRCGVFPFETQYKNIFTFIDDFIPINISSTEIRNENHREVC